MKPLPSPTGKTALPFIKMHGLGNDFVMMDARDLPPGISLEKLAARVCDRHFGIGADGLIVADQPTDPQRFDIRFMYLNSDGSWAEMCGNGIRCFALFVKDQGILDRDEFVAETLAGPISPKLNPDRTVTVNMGAPILEAQRIPFASSNGLSPDAVVQDYPVEVLSRKVPVSTVSMGNPHCLIFQDDLEPLEPAVFGPALEKHPSFPAKTNVEFIRMLDRHQMDVVVWERGCGFTLACGTGACASAVAAIMAGKAESPVQVNLPGGPLKIEWDGNPTSPVLMTGPASYVFEGTFPLSLKELQE